MRLTTIATLGLALLSLPALSMADHDNSRNHRGVQQHNRSRQDNCARRGASNAEIRAAFWRDLYDHQADVRRDFYRHCNDTCESRRNSERDLCRLLQCQEEERCALRDRLSREYPGN